ncbi:MAG: Cif family virulence factor [Acidiferrobacterales bacterium]
MDSKIAGDLLAALMRTASDKDYAAHMDLISRQVAVFGVPGFEVIGYDDWAAQCRHEFERNILKRVSYSGLKVLTMTPGSIMFKTLETVEATDGTVNVNGVEIVIRKEDDGKWRVLQERILPPDELEFDRRVLQ